MHTYLIIWNGYYYIYLYSVKIKLFVKFWITTFVIFWKKILIEVLLHLKCAVIPLFGLARLYTTLIFSFVSLRMFIYYFLKTIIISAWDIIKGKNNNTNIYWAITILQALYIDDHIESSQQYFSRYYCCSHFTNKS